MIMRSLILVAVLAFAGCEPPPPPPPTHQMVSATIVKVYKEFPSIGQDWKTTVELPNGVRKVMPGRLGKEGETIRVRVPVRDLE